MEFFDLESIVLLVNKYVPASILLVVGALGSLVVTGTTIVAVSPSKKDDEKLEEWKKVRVVGWILKFLSAFSAIQKKEGSVFASNNEKPK